MDHARIRILWMNPESKCDIHYVNNVIKKRGPIEHHIDQSDSIPYQD
jgi:hypothetical protein